MSVLTAGTRGHPSFNWKPFLPVLLAVVLALLPPFSGLTRSAWLYFALFAGVIMALILEPIPGAAVGLVGVGIATALGLVDPRPAQSIAWGLSGFSNTTVWLIFAAYTFALGYEKTGLGRRVALSLVKLLGRRSLGLGYAVALSDLVLAPFTPSNTARSGGTIYPIIRGIPPLYGSLPGPTARKIGSYLMWTALVTTCITSSMFLTAMAPNLLAVALAAKTAKVSFTWVQWFMGFLPLGIVLFFSAPLVVYWLYPPEIKQSDDVPAWAASELEKIGPMTGREIGMAALVAVALIFWVIGGQWIDATAVAIGGVALMIVLGIISWDDVLAHRQSWSVLVWFATLVTLADGLGRVGFLSWFAKQAAGTLHGVPVMAFVLALVAFFFLMHYMFASITAHTTALLPVFLAAAASVPGVPIKLLTLALLYSLGLMGILDPYATGPSPIYFGSGYINRRDFWTLGLVFGVIFLVGLLVLEVPYLSMLYR